MKTRSRCLNLGSCVKTHCSWILHQDPFCLGPASGPRSLGFCVGTQSSCILYQDSRFLNLGFLNIIIFLIIQSIHLKNIIICVMISIIFLIIQSIHLKNIIICVINIYFFIIQKRAQFPYYYLPRHKTLWIEAV